MVSTIDMQLMRYINLFSRISKVHTTKVFVYNNVIVFAVPKPLVSKAVGKDGANVKKLGETLRRKIKVISIANEESKEDIERFVSDVVSPVTFNKIEFKDGGVVVSAGRQSKAALIGRGRVREKELSEVLRNFFKIKGVRIA
tara:strand:+ start:185 stop:610 length:426 start_codon:yes stop_codon:yes gene_type:complete